MSSAEKHYPTYTVDDYQSWPGDWELWDGHPIAMGPSPFGPHAKIQSRILILIGNAISEAQCNAEVLTELDWIVSPKTVVRPDVLVVCGDAPEKHLVSRPELIVEVLSASTREQDLGFKKNLFLDQAVPYYLVADPATQELRIFQLKENAYSELPNSKQIQLQICGNCKLTIDTTRVFF